MIVFSVKQQDGELRPGKLYVAKCSSHPYNSSEFSPDWVIDDTGMMVSTVYIDVDQLIIHWGGVVVNQYRHDDMSYKMDQLISAVQGLVLTSVNETNPDVTQSLQAITALFHEMLSDKDEQIKTQVEKQVGEMRAKISEKYHDLDIEELI